MSATALRIVEGSSMDKTKALSAALSQIERRSAARDEAGRTDRSIWESAADRALVLSMEDPSTIRRAVADIGRAPYGGDSLAGQTGGRTDELLVEQ